MPHRFVCFTDDSTGLNSAIEIHALPNNQALHGWWWKLYLFQADHFPDGDTILFFDLDMVIVGNIDKIVEYLPGEFVGLEDVGRVFNRPPKLGSAVMRWQANNFSNIWTEFAKNRAFAQKWHGDQDWIWMTEKDSIKFFPREWIISYKWEARNMQELIRENGKSRFRDVRSPVIPADTCVLAFHGTPNPHEVLDAIVVDNWQ